MQLDVASSRGHAAVPPRELGCYARAKSGGQRSPHTPFNLYPSAVAAVLWFLATTCRGPAVIPPPPRGGQPAPAGVYFSENTHFTQEGFTSRGSGGGASRLLEFTALQTSLKYWRLSFIPCCCFFKGKRHARRQIVVIINFISSFDLSFMNPTFSFTTGWIVTDVFSSLIASSANAQLSPRRLMLTRSRQWEKQEVHDDECSVYIKPSANQRLFTAIKTNNFCLPLLAVWVITKTLPTLLTHVNDVCLQLKSPPRFPRRPRSDSSCK